MMPRVADNLLWSTAFLYRSSEDARDAKGAGGTGFLVSVPSEALPSMTTGYIYAVTNAHVVAQGGTTLRVDAPLEPTLPTVYGVDIVGPDEIEWVMHPDGDDLAVALLTPHLLTGRLKFCRWTVPLGALLSFDTANKFGIGPGDEVFTVGRLIDSQGIQRQNPSVRFGHLSVLGVVPIRQSDRAFDQESILVEILSIGGFSGSPVIMRIPHLYTRATSSMEQWAFGPWLLGVCWGHISNTHEPVVDDNGRRVKNRRVKRNTGIMATVPAWKLRALLMCDELRAERAKLDEQIEKVIKNRRDSESSAT